MKITVHKLAGERYMEAASDEGGTIRMDGTRTIGGLEGGMSPMQLLLAAAGGCSMIDIVGILEKQRQKLDAIRVEVEGDRQKVETWSEYKSIHMHFILKGELDAAKVKRAIELSVGKYCSVSKTLEKTAVISHSFEIENG